MIDLVLRAGTEFQAVAAQKGRDEIERAFNLMTGLENLIRERLDIEWVEANGDL
ncbi:MAG: hypothetical protein AAF713_03260 [Pseudomonadota bacterium]